MDFIYSFWYNAPTLLQTGATVEMKRQFHLNRGTGRQQCRCTVPKVVYTVKKCSLGLENLSPETCRADLKRLIKEKLLNPVGCLHHTTFVKLVYFSLSLCLSLCLYVSPSFRMEQLVTHRTAFHKTKYLKISSKFLSRKFNFH